MLSVAKSRVLSTMQERLSHHALIHDTAFEVLLSPIITEHYCITLFGVECLADPGQPGQSTAKPGQSEAAACREAQPNPLPF